MAATAGAVSPTIATITWDPSSDNSAVQGYHVWRSTTAVGVPTLLGGTTLETFADTSGVPGQPYFYRVSAYDYFGNESAKSDPAVGPVSATWTQAPHAPYSSASRMCRMCHAPHVADTQESLLRDTGATSGEVGVCYTCHDGQGATTNIATGAENSFALSSGHTVEQLGAAGDLTNSCSGCHAPHVDYTTNRMLPRTTINGTTVTGANNTWCLACHNDANTWYGAGYPSLASPTRDATGYPTAGTFPGRTTYVTPSANAHGAIPASATATPARVVGDCQYCHASHKGANGYDGLLETFRPSTASTLVNDQLTGAYAESCFDCHGGQAGRYFSAPGPTGAVNVKQFVTDSTDQAGHRIKTAGGTLPVGAPLPCYDCHNPHGSKRGNKQLLSDALGQSLETSMTTGGAYLTRRFCFTCHTSSDDMVWNSVTATYTAVGTDSVEGLRRDGSLPVGGNALLLPVVTGHDKDDAHSCYQCHGKDYAPGGRNVHNPSAGVSNGGEPCYACHAGYNAPMEYNGTSRTTYYHHVMGTASTPGDNAFASTAYPPQGTDVYCLSCHVDHDKFNNSQSSNLRASIGVLAGTATAADTDFAAASPYGVCLGCHAAERAKDNTNQKSSANTAGADNTANTPAISGEAFNGSKHQYIVSSTFGDATTFKANCSKCHNDEDQGSYKAFQTSGNKFGTHWNTSRRILGALGLAVPVSDNPFSDENFCFRCHSLTTDTVPGTKKTVVGRDWYGNAGAVMDAASQNVFGQFQLTNKHNVAGYAGLHKPATTDEGSTYMNTLANKHVECADCHNPHAAGETTHVQGTNNASAVLTAVRGFDWAIGTATEWTTANATYTWKSGDSAATGVTKEYGACLRCHSSRNTQLTTWSSNWTQVDLEFNTMNDSYHPVFGALPLTDPGINLGSSQLAAVQLGNQWTAGVGQTMYCSDCHGAMASDPQAMGPHGSTARRVLKGYYPKMANGTTDYTLNMVDTGTATDLLCIRCHTMVVAGTFNNNAHDRTGNHGDVACTTCHISRPHGGKMSRFIVDLDTTPAAYQGANVGMRSFRKVARTAYAQGDCLTGGSCGTQHNGSTANENW